LEGLEEVCGIATIFPSTFNFSMASSWATDGFMTAYTALSGPDTQSMPVKLKEEDNFTSWELDIDFVVGKDDNTQLTVEDTIMSLVSKETLCWSRKARVEPLLEEHELGGSTMLNPGPPFKVGDVLLCDIPGQLWGMDPLWSWLQQGFVMEVDHPSHKIQMEKGAMVWTNTR
jgi:hypothetical protein